jgi:hypothetical protein
MPLMLRPRRGHETMHRTDDQGHQAEQLVAVKLEEARTAATLGRPHTTERDGQVLALVKGLLPEGRKTYLGRYGLAELDVCGLNQVLQRHGVVLQHDLPSQEYPEWLVKVRTAETGWASATRFWLASSTVPAEPVDPATGIRLKHIVRIG